MEMNWIAIVVVAIVPMIMGALWYGPLFGKQWQNSMGFSDEDVNSGNMTVTFGVAFIMAILLSMGLSSTIQFVHGAEGSYNTFQHGAFHGVMLSLFISIPVLVSNSLFQKNNGKNIIINVAYWMITMAIMGGILDIWV